MKLGTFAAAGSRAWRAALFDANDRVVDLDAALQLADPALREPLAADREFMPVDPRFWLDPARRAVIERLATTSSSKCVHRLPDVTVGPPVAQPGKVIAVGRNYMNHVKEGQQIWAARGKKVELPTFPAAFAKFVSALAATDSDIRIPMGVRAVDYEIELAIVIGRHAFNVTEADALSFVAGYTICNDIGARELQRLEMESQIGITLSKNFPTFGPMGPWMVTADEIDDPQALTMELRVNGKRRQHASTADMIFTVRQIVAYWSRIGLQPGDIISTGTPSGVALAMPDPENYYLKNGDVVEAEIGRIGRLVNRVVEAPPAQADTR
jgi:2-keto-4-pentenoate hydratase/2-oxohepta-3-ene-1,7-dioic acid hydratase in catechol pathway